MLRQSSSRGHRSKKLRATHSFQAFLLVAVAIWIVYQLTHAFGERRPVVVETGTSSNSNAGSARRRLGRKGFVHFAGRASVVDGASVDGIAGVSSWSDDGSSSDDPLSSKAGDGDGKGDEEEREGDDDDNGAADGDVDDADDGLAVVADEEDDGIDFQSREDGPKAVQGGTQNGLKISIVTTVNGTGTVPDDAAVLLSNATVGAADGHGTVPTLSDFASALTNISSVDVASLRDRGTAGDVANSFTVGVTWSRGETSHA